MTWHNALTGQGFIRWLLQVAGTNRVPQGQPLDPFVSSMRVLKYTSSRLASIEQNEALEGDASQKIVDLAAADLVIYQDGAATLSQLGANVLNKWRKADITNENSEDELPRCFALVQEAHSLKTGRYMRMLEFWQEVRQVFNPDEMISSPTALYLLSYLNQKAHNYNPWRVIQATSEVVDREVIDWDELKQGLPDLDEEGEQAVNRLARRVEDWQARSEGRVNFCRAMELFVLSPDEAEAALLRWDLPDRTKNRCFALLPLAAAEPTKADEKVLGLIELLLERHNVILYGPPGTGKTYHAFAVANEWRQRYGEGTTYKVTFHPSYGYEDFVEGYRPVEGGSGEFVLQPGILQEVCKRATELAEIPGGALAAKVLLVIDEINRGDISRIFGELITLIEPDKRGIPVNLSQSPTKIFSMPYNVYFLGTMNTADKSISLLDVALRRRFAFQEYPPDPTIFEDQEEWVDTVRGLHLGEILRNLNNRLLEEGIEIDRAIGHALLKIPKSTLDSVKALRRRFEYDIYPLVLEYSYVDRSRVRRILGRIVDSVGRFDHSLTDDEFLQAVASIANQELTSVERSEFEPVEPLEEVEDGIDEDEAQ